MAAAVAAADVFEQPRPQWRLEPERRRRRHPGEFKMAAGAAAAAGLREEQRYGLSCGGWDRTTSLYRM